MKTTVSVNIGGLAFNMDEDAYDVLNKYLKRVKKYYVSEEGCDEIIADIESRIADLFRERLANEKQVVVMNDVVEVLGIMGDPADFEEAKTDERTSLMKKGGGRIYRDVDNRIVAGVCRGLAAHWSIDPVIVRVLFIAFSFFGGSAIVVYIILWIVLPPAMTTAQKIEMKGEPVNIDNIKNTVREEFNNVRERFKKKKD